jgi:hypothetical protein
MDTTRMSQGQMVAAVGGVLLIVALFLTWGDGANAFDAFSGMDIIMLIIGIIAVAWGVAAGMGAVTPPALSGMLVGLLGVAVLGFTLGTDLEVDDADIGAWLALAASIAIAWGGLSAGSRRVAAPAATRGPATTTASPPPPSDPAV